MRKKIIPPEISVPGATEFERFRNLTREVVAVPKSEIDRREKSGEKKGKSMAGEKDDPKQAFSGIEELLMGLGVSHRFFSELEKDDDWAFVIKLHGLMENALTHLLIKHFGDDRLKEVFTDMDNSDPKKGRLAFVTKLELLPKQYSLFIGQFSKLRNALAHNARNHGFSLDAFIGGLDANQKSNWRKSVRPPGEGKIFIRRTGETISPEDFLDRFPRAAFTGTVHDMMFAIYRIDALRSGQETKVALTQTGTVSMPNESNPKG